LKADVVAHTCNIWDLGGEHRGLRVQSQPGLYKETLSQKKKKKKKLDTLSYACNASTWQTEAGELKV
jgi:hypothetical protein